MNAAIIVATQNMTNANISAGGPGPALWMLHGFICLFIFMAVTSSGTLKTVDRAGKILVAWLIVSIPLFVWLF